jgi:hypothetical protein
MCAAFDLLRRNRLTGVSVGVRSGLQGRIVMTPEEASPRVS